MDLSIDINRGQAARKIENHYHSLPCPGPEQCMFDKSEEERQRRFEKHTGITCPGGARAALKHLLETGVFDYKQMELAWRKRAIWWDWHNQILKVTVSRLELGYGLFLMWVGILFFLATVFGVFFVNGRKPLTTANLTWIVIGLLFLTVVPFAEKHMVRPNRIARRVKPLLDSFYAKKT